MEPKNQNTQLCSDLEENGSHLHYGYGVRHIQVVCMTISLMVMFIVRSSFSVAVLGMTDQNRSTNLTIFDWDKKCQSIIHSAFFWCYLIGQIPGGLLAKRFGGKPLVVGSLIINGLFSVASPVLVTWGGWAAMAIIRAALGLAQSAIMPAIHTILGRWLPERERTFYLGVVYGGTKLGTIIGLPLSGILAETSIGWSLIFYTTGVISLGFGILVWIFSASTPSEHRMITTVEKTYIEYGLTKNSAKTLKTPWKGFLKCRGLYAIILNHIVFAIYFYLFFTDLPTFLEKALGLSIKSSATLSALPYIGMWVSGITASGIFGYFMRKGYIKLSTSRKLADSVSNFGTAGGLIALCFINQDNKSYAVVILVITYVFGGFFVAGFVANHLDLSPNFGGIMLAISNTIATAFAALTPIAVAFILQNDSTNLYRWRVVFLIVAGCCVIGNLISLIFGDVRRQEWDDIDKNNTADGNPDELEPVLHRNNENLVNK